MKSSSDIPARVERLRARFEEAECEAAAITNLANVRYLTGFSGSAGLLIVRVDRSVLITDGRYEFQAADQIRAAGVEVEVKIGKAPEQKALAGEAASGVKRLGLEAGSVAWAQQRSYATEWFPDAELVPTEGLVEKLRRVKDDGEIARMAEAARIADEALGKVKSRLAERPTEREVAAELDFEMRRLGAEGAAYETIVAAGPNAAKPHARPGDRRIESGELVVIDVGAVVDGYRSDMTRTFCIGEPASQQQQDMYDAVIGAQLAGLAAVRAGVEAREVDSVCREALTAAGLGAAFMHSTGHGVGLDIHEGPLLGQTSTDTLEAGNVVTVEPGVYLPEHGGVRIEDLVVVTDGGGQRLTHFPKDLTV